MLGSGDVGLIMARRLTLEKASSCLCRGYATFDGLNRNYVQCLKDTHDIPLYLSHTITNIRGQRRVEVSQFKVIQW